MPEYRRLRTEGGCVFFTLALAERRSSLLIQHIDLLWCAVTRVRHLMPFDIEAWVVLPEHMHCIWTLPEGDSDHYARRWKAIKLLFSLGLRPARS